MMMMVQCAQKFVTCLSITNHSLFIREKGCKLTSNSHEFASLERFGIHEPNSFF
uniref:Uncharacterized protein n=1 Tax=Arundo donax TaxID=35708 RepID=A0A0A8ZLU7_ARUDO